MSPACQGLIFVTCFAASRQGGGESLPDDGEMAGRMRPTTGSSTCPRSSRNRSRRPRRWPRPSLPGSDSPRRTVHDLDALATQLENAYRGHARGAEELKRFAAAIRDLDGNTRAAHLARCHAPPVEMPERTAARIGCAMRRDQAAVGGVRTNLAVIGLRIGSVRAILFHSCGTPVAGSTRSARGPRVRIAMKRNR